MFGYISGDGKMIEIAKPVFTIGRHESNDLVIHNGSVTSFHAKLIFENGQASIQDLGSRNGTFVNDYRIRTQPFKLISDNILRFGIYQARFRVGFTQLQTLEKISNAIVNYQKESVDKQIESILQKEMSNNTQSNTVQHYPENSPNLLQMSLNDLKNQESPIKPINQSSQKDDEHKSQQSYHKSKNSQMTDDHKTNKSQNINVEQNQNHTLKEQQIHISHKLIDQIRMSLKQFDFNEAVRLSTKFGETQVERSLQDLIKQITQLPKTQILPISEQLKNLNVIISQIQENTEFVNYKQFKQDKHDFITNNEVTLIQKLKDEIYDLKEENSYLRNISKLDDSVIKKAIRASQIISDTLSKLSVGEINGLNIAAIITNHKNEENGSWRFM